MCVFACVYDNNILNVVYINIIWIRADRGGGVATAKSGETVLPVGEGGGRCNMYIMCCNYTGRQGVWKITTKTAKRLIHKHRFGRTMVFMGVEYS